MTNCDDDVGGNDWVLFNCSISSVIMRRDMTPMTFQSKIEAELFQSEHGAPREFEPVQVRTIAEAMRKLS